MTLVQIQTHGSMKWNKGTKYKLMQLVTHFFGKKNSQNIKKASSTKATVKTKYPQIGRNQISSNYTVKYSTLHRLKAMSDTLMELRITFQNIDIDKNALIKTLVIQKRIPTVDKGDLTK